MKKIVTIIIGSLLLVSCKEGAKKDDALSKSTTYVSFGEKISVENAISAEEMGEKFSHLKDGDTIDVKFTSTIQGVCKKKGCWMKVGVGEGKQSFVRFKDYGFFMPMNSEGSEVIVNGKAYIHKIPVKQLQHYAKDAGKTEEEIAKITEPKINLSFMADGVLLAQPNEKK